MAFQAMTMTVLTHPLQALLMGMVVLHGVRAALSAVRRCGAGHGSDSIVTTGHFDLPAAA